jgi:hypothetical protein
MSLDKRIAKLEAHFGSQSVHEGVHVVVVSLVQREDIHGNQDIDDDYRKPTETEREAAAEEAKRRYGRPHGWIYIEWDGHKFTYEGEPL